VRATAHSLGDLQPARAGHLDIKEHDVGGMSFDRAQGFVAIRRFLGNDQLRPQLSQRPSNLCA
jgi:hypothetical protein